jgi:hypothetical protein
MRKIFILLILITSTLYFACRKETAYSDTKNLKINDAKVWMNKFLETNQIDPMFKDIVYHWDKASNFVFKNGYSAITVPLTNNNQNPSYTGRRVLYLYPWKNGKGYYSTIFELIPESNHVKNNNGKIELKIFDGLIMTWDLKQGFVRGANFINGIPQKNIQVEYRKTRINDLHDSSQQTANTTTLPGVTVVGFIPSANWGFFFVSLMNSLGYSTSYLWNAGGGNPCEYSGCGYSENPSDYFDPNTLNEINNNLRDEQWLDENVKDSTNNPCATDVINKLSSISDKLPKLIRDFFSSDANFSMTIKMSDLGSGVGGNTVPNVSTNSFNVNLNSHFNNATDLAMATTIIHEAFHCQLMSWFREAVSNNDVTTKQQLAAAYGYLFRLK